MKNELLPANFPGINGDVYAGFFLRLGALLLDGIILLPYMALTIYIQGLSIAANYYVLLPMLLFSLWFNVYLVKRYGGTPGKLIMKIKIIQKDGTDISWQAAALRFAGTLILSLLGFWATILSLNMIDNDTFVSLGFFKRMTFMQELNPLPYKVQMWSQNSWYLAGLIVLLSNKRKRAIHDFIAGTVVIQSFCLDKIREIRNTDENHENTIE